VTLHPCPRNHEDHEESEGHEAKISQVRARVSAFLGVSLRPLR